MASALPAPAPLTCLSGPKGSPVPSLLSSLASARPRCSGTPKRLTAAAAAKGAKKGKKVVRRTGQRKEDGADAAWGEGGEEQGEAQESISSREEGEEETGKEGVVGMEGQGQRQRSSRGAEEGMQVTVGDAVDGKLQVAVKLPGAATRATYDRILAELSRTCPPVPGARISKGGKASRVDPSVVLRLVGKSRVTGFVVKELVNASLATLVDQKGLNADKEAKTLQDAEELAQAFEPGQPFAFDAVLTLLGPADAAASEPAADARAVAEAVQ